MRRSGGLKWATDEGATGAFVAEMDFGVAPAVTRALHAAVDEGLFAYLPPRYRTGLQRAASGFLERTTGWRVPPERIHEMPDVIACLQAAIEHFCEPGGAVIVPTPAYMPFLFVRPAMGRAVIEVPMIADAVGRPFRHDLAAIERAFDAGGRLLILCNPHNPTGRVFTRAELAALEELVDRRGGRVFSDEIWLPLVYSGHTHVPYASIGPVAAGHTVTATAASKAFNLPGLKCAQLITANDADQASWLDVGMLAMQGAANLGLVATTAAYTEGGPWLADVLAYLERNRDDLERFVAERMPPARVTHAEGTYIAWLDLGASDLPAEVRPLLLEQAAVSCTEGTMCGAVGAGHVRFVFALPHPVMLAALERIAAVLERVGPRR